MILDFNGIDLVEGLAPNERRCEDHRQALVSLGREVKPHPSLHVNTEVYSVSG